MYSVIVCSGLVHLKSCRHKSLGDNSLVCLGDNGEHRTNLRFWTMHYTNCINDNHNATNTILHDWANIHLCDGYHSAGESITSCSLSQRK